MIAQRPSDVQKYTGCNHILAPGIHMAMCNPTVILYDRGKQWLMEWDHYAGPTVVTKKGDVAKNQPGEKSRFWLVAVWWKDQGCQVVDGVGIWKEPPIVEVRYRRQARGKMAGLHADPNGPIVLRHYQGYEQLGYIR